MSLDLYTVIHITYEPKRLMCGIYTYTCMFSEGIPLDSSTVSAESLQPWRMTVRQSILEDKNKIPLSHARSAKHRANEAVTTEHMQGSATAQCARQKPAAFLGSISGSLLDPSHRHEQLASGKYSFPNNGMNMTQKSTQTSSDNTKTESESLISSNAEAKNAIGGTTTPSNSTAWSNAILGRTACAKCGELSEVCAAHGAPRLCLGKPMS